LGYDDPIAIREYISNTILVAEGYTPDGRKIMVLNGGRYEFREIR
jgi:hypothetical protein